MATPDYPLLQAAYLREQRNFPREDLTMLSRQIDQAYIDIAAKMNQRTIGTFPVGANVITGEKYYFKGGSSNQPQQTLRQVFNFTATGNIAHNINFNSVYFIAPQSYGSFTDGTNYYGAIYASSTAISGQVSFYVTSSNIVVLAGAGAPSITSGIIVLTWISNY